MKTTADFLDDLRARHGLASDGKLALHMGWQRAQLGKYRAKRETFSDETALKVAVQLGIEPAYIMACMAWQRSKTPETRSAWERIARKVAAAVVLCAGLSGILHNQNVRANPSSPLPGPIYTYAAMRDRRRQGGAGSRLGAALALSRLLRALMVASLLAVPSASWAADDWTGWDTTRELGYQGALLVDCSQTWRGSVEHPGQFEETNPVNGAHPSRGRVALACLGSSAGHYLISHWLSPKSRELWQNVTLFAELYAVANNNEAGLRVGITF